MTRSVPGSLLLLTLAGALRLSAAAAPSKKPLTFGAFFHAVDISAVKMAPDGNAVVIGTRRADYAHNRFRSDLWIYRMGSGGRGGELLPLADSGHDSAPQWSPDGRWVAFLSDRAKHGAQLYVVHARGGSPDLLTYAAGGVHSYAWSANSRLLYYAATQPLTKAQKKAHQRKWRDVRRYMRDRRSDNIYRVWLPPATEFSSVPPRHSRVDHFIAHTPWRVAQMLATADGHELIYNTCARRGPIYITGTDGYKKHEIYEVNLAAGNRTRQLTHNQALEGGLRLAPDGRGLFFIANTNIPGVYGDLSGRIFYQPLAGGNPTRLAPGYGGTFRDFALSPGGRVVSTGQSGVEVPIYSVTRQAAQTLTTAPGTYQALSIARHARRMAFVYSTLTSPVEVYLANDYRHPAAARMITHFNDFLAARRLPRGRSVSWRADDGTRIQGMLIFPPGKFNARHLPLFVLIHGGPEDADVNHWEADWYQWASLAASNGWLVFEPNYRGSSGYGDAFMHRIVPHIVSRPGKDILEGVQSLLRAGWADPKHMAVGGYSYGGYMTDWLITQTTEFHAAVTGAGAIENTANWGNDDLNYDDTWYLDGLPWQNEAIYNSEAAIWQMAKVKTPTQIVMGTADQRVSTCEDFLLDRALRAVGVPTEMLMFPGEHHGLGNNPWHGRIKVREELKWLAHYAGPTAMRRRERRQYLREVKARAKQRPAVNNSRRNQRRG